MNKIEDIEKNILKILAGKKSPNFTGDTVKVNVRIVEGKRQRVQAFEGVCIAKKGGINSSFTVEKYLSAKVWKEFFNYIVQT